MKKYNVELTEKNMDIIKIALNYYRKSVKADMDYADNNLLADEFLVWAIQLDHIDNAITTVINSETK